MKILFIEQHSMKLGNRVFYTLEASRQRYLTAIENWPYVSGALALVYFVGFALWTPMHAKLLKEAAFSVVLGGATASLYPYHYRRVWMANVCTVYNDLRKAIKLNPALAKPDDDTAINKNFGPSKWNTNDSSLENEEDIEMENKLTIWDGSGDLDGKERKAAIMSNL